MKKYIFIALALAFGLLCFEAAFIITRDSKDREISKLNVKLDAQTESLQFMSKNGQAYAQSAARNLNKADFEQMFSDQYKLFSKDLSLKAIDHYTDAQTITTNNIHTRLRDSTIRDTVHVKAFTYNSRSLKLNGYTTRDSAFVKWKHFLQLQIASGKEPRDGFWNKITMNPWHRKTVVKAISSDTNTVITNIQSITIR